MNASSMFGALPGPVSVPLWHSSLILLPLPWVPGPKRRGRRPLAVLRTVLPASLLGLHLLGQSLFACADMLGLPGLFPVVEVDAWLDSVRLLNEANAYWSRPDVDPLAAPVQRPRPTTAAQPGGGRGVDSPLADDRGPKGRCRRRNQATPEIAAGAFSDEAIQGLVDDWIIPMIVEDVMRGKVERRYDADRRD